MKKKKDTDYFKDMRSFAVGTAGLGVTVGAAGAIGATSPVAVTGGLSTMASFTPVMGTMVGAGSVLKQVKKLNKKKY